LPALYIPIMAMLFGLILRGIAFEFRFRDPRHAPAWSVAFAGGSLIATIAQGMTLGAFIDGFELHDGAFAGGPLDWLTPFGLMTGLALLAGYALLGSSWLVLKLEGRLQRWAARACHPLLLAVMIGIGIVSLWTPLAHEEIAQRWFSWPNLLYLSPVPL